MKNTSITTTIDSLEVGQKACYHMGRLAKDRKESSDLNDLALRLYNESTAWYRFSENGYNFSKATRIEKHKWVLWQEGATKEADRSYWCKRIL